MPILRARDRKRLRKLQDAFLDCAFVRRFLNYNSPTTPLWEGGPSRNELADFVYPQWEEMIRSLMREHGCNSDN